MDAALLEACSNAKAAGVHISRRLTR